MLKRKRHNIIKVLLLLIVIGFLVTTCDLPEGRVSNISSALEVHFIDVGQADCVLLKLPDGKAMLIDAGNNADGVDIVEYIRKEGISKIDYLVGTHPHADHIGGMDDVIENFEIKNIYMPKATANTKTYEEVLLAVKDKGLKINEAKAGEVICSGEVQAEILSPSGENYEELNDYSAVIRLTFGEKSFLFTGDAEKRAEEEIVGAYVLESDVLKVGHHGSATSSSQSFLDAVNPDIAVISVGEDNDYGHPSSKVLKRLENMGVIIYRTDIHGDIVMLCDGANIEVICEKQED